jgi:peptidoglycan/xylan/chitin deacetylase (PgdA/CDA1 family)
VTVGLRIDVDTFRGTRDGLPRLLALLERRKVRATWFVTLGPDNMGRHVRRMLRPSFAWKMLRSGAPSLYGWDIVLRGTLWPGPVISRRLADTLRLPDRAGHEVALHAWDHHRWQLGAEHLGDAALDAELARAKEAFASVYGREPHACAAPGWRCDDRVLARPGDSAGAATRADLPSRSARTSPGSDARSTSRRCRSTFPPTTRPSVAARTPTTTSTACCSRGSRTGARTS